VAAVSNAELQPLWDRLKGGQLSVVAFVQDYHQLQFDGPALTIYNTFAVVTAGGVHTRVGEPGFRDRLCEQITKVVRAVAHRQDDGLTVAFEDGSAIEVSLRSEDYK